MTTADKMATAVDRRGWNQAVRPGQNGMGSPGRSPFLTGPLSPHILHSIGLQWSEKTERVLMLQKKEMFAG